MECGYTFQTYLFQLINVKKAADDNRSTFMPNINNTKAKKEKKNWRARDTYKVKKERKKEKKNERGGAPQNNARRISVKCESLFD